MKVFFFFNFADVILLFDTLRVEMVVECESGGRGEMCMFSEIFLFSTEHVMVMFFGQQFI